MCEAYQKIWYCTFMFLGEWMVFLAEDIQVWHVYHEPWCFHTVGILPYVAFGPNARNLPVPWTEMKSNLKIKMRKIGYIDVSAIPVVASCKYIANCFKHSEGREAELDQQLQKMVQGPMLLIVSESYCLKVERCNVQTKGGWSQYEPNKKGREDRHHTI